MLELALSHWENLGTLQTFERLNVGANDNYSVQTDKGKYFLKLVTEPLSRANLNRFPAFYNRMRDGGLPHVSPVALPTGDLVLQNGDIHAILYPFVDSTPAIPNVDNARQIGKLLARLHTLPTDNLPDKANWFTPSFVDECLLRISSNSVNLPGFEEVVSLHDDARTEIDTLPFDLGIVHGDLHYGNTLVTQTGEVLMIDWEETGVSSALHDLGMSILGLCWEGGNYLPELYTAFVEAYFSTRKTMPYTSDEIRLAVVYAATLNTIWHVNKYFVQMPDPKKQPHWDCYYFCRNLDKWMP